MLYYKSLLFHGLNAASSVLECSTNKEHLESMNEPLKIKDFLKDKISSLKKMLFSK